MGSQGIFLVRDGKLSVLSQEPYDSEDVFQKALADFPEVLAGGTTGDEGFSRRLLLVQREMGVPSTEGGGATWSLDHLFVDDSAVPVFVEVKRSSDTRIRREVVGQMLDYAANGIAYWPIAELRNAVDAAAKGHGLETGDAVLNASLGIDDADQFWRDVERNLRDGNVRLVFVADRLPTELVRIIEFLNETMTPTEVLGVEVKQYLGDGHQLLVPQHVGRTARALTTKNPTRRTRWDAASFLDVTKARHGEAVASLFERLFAHVRDHGGRLSWGSGVSPGVSGWYPLHGSDTPLWSVNAGVYYDKSGIPSTDEPSLYIYPGEIRQRVGQSKFSEFIDQLWSIGPYRKKLEEAKGKNWVNKYPTLNLSSVLANPNFEEILLNAITILVEASTSEPETDDASVAADPSLAQ